MSYKTQRIAAKIKEFNANPYVQDLTKVFGALEHRSLGYKHFEQAKRHLTGMIKASQEAVVYSHIQDSIDTNPNQRLADRKLDFSLMYMTVNMSDEDILMPMHMRALITPDMALCCTRELPLHLSSQHLEFRHIQRTCAPLDYASDDFKYAVAFSLALAAVMEKDMELGSEPQPCLIPHSSGVFLGVAQNKGNYWTDTQAAFRHFNNGQPFVDQLAGDSYGSGITIELKTSISRREISHGQALLRDQLLLADYPNAEKIIARGMDIHGLCAMHKVIPSSEKDAWHALCRQLQTVVRSPLWREESRRAMQNLKRHDYN